MTTHKRYHLKCVWGSVPSMLSPCMTTTSSGTQGKNGLLSVHQRLRGAARGAKYQREGGDMGRVIRYDRLINTIILLPAWTDKRLMLHLTKWKCASQYQKCFKYRAPWWDGERIPIVLRVSVGWSFFSFILTWCDAIKVYESQQGMSICLLWSSIPQL